MDTPGKNTITVSSEIALPIEKVWRIWTTPEHITQWNFANKDWQCPAAENDLKPGGKFNWRMEAKDGSAGFDYSGVYKKVIPNDKLIMELDDGRAVQVQFTETESGVIITETFEVEDQNSIELQKNGWQAILNNFRAYALSRK